jgi:hypothetical protein
MHAPDSIWMKDQNTPAQREGKEEGTPAKQTMLALLSWGIHDGRLDTMIPVLTVISIWVVPIVS